MVGLRHGVTYKPWVNVTAAGPRHSVVETLRLGSDDATGQTYGWLRIMLISGHAGAKPAHKRVELAFALH